MLKEVSLAMLSGDAEKVLSMTTKKFQDSLLSGNKKMLEEAKNNKEMQKVLGEQFGEKFEELNDFVGLPCPPEPVRNGF